jgi:hypothetical protein
MKPSIGRKKIKNSAQEPSRHLGGVVVLYVILKQSSHYCENFKLLLTK